MSTASQMSVETSAATGDELALALITPFRDSTVTTATATTTAAMAMAMATATIPTDRDVLCGRGKGVRVHAGNILYNKLLREHYDEYKAAPKGSKVLIVKKIVWFIREEQPGGSGRFLERTKSKSRASETVTVNTCHSGNHHQNTSSWTYIDIGHERAMYKTAQAFRDIRATMGKHNSQTNNTRTTSEEEDGSEDSSSCSLGKLVPPTGRAPSDLGEGGECPVSRRPTFQERLAMLHRQQQRENSDDDNEESHHSKEESVSGNEDDVSDTETEDSFPMYDPNK